jgi:hypothetical protein
MYVPTCIMCFIQWAFKNCLGAKFIECRNIQKLKQNVVTLSCGYVRTFKVILWIMVIWESSTFEKYPIPHHLINSSSFLVQNSPWPVARYSNAQKIPAQFVLCVEFLAFDPRKTVTTNFFEIHFNINIFLSTPASLSFHFLWDFPNKIFRNIFIFLLPWYIYF